MNEGTSRPFGYVAVGLALAGLLAFVGSWTAGPPPIGRVFLLLALAALLAEWATVILPRGSASLSFPLSLAANLLLGPTSAGVIAIIAGVGLADIKERVGGYVIAFNTGQTLLATLCSGWLYLWLGGRTLWLEGTDFLPLSERDFPQILLPLLVLGLSATVLNVLLVGLGMMLKHQLSLSYLWSQGLGALFPVQLSLSVVAVSIAQVMSIQPIGLVLFVFPLLVSRQVYQRYLALEQSYIDTVRSLVAALEAKDLYTAGHSERVAAYAVDIARSMGQSDEAVERIDLAAQVHDLGKVGIPNDILSKPGRLTAAEFDAIRNHPEVGAEIVARVPGLAHLVPIVRHHHERFDGEGYCGRLAGEEIPIEARIMAVADSFDAMTSSRAYRPAMTRAAAVEEMKACSGTQFDSEVVEHFVRCLSSVEVEE